MGVGLDELSALLHQRDSALALIRKLVESAPRTEPVEPLLTHNHDDTRDFAIDCALWHAAQQFHSLLTELDVRDSACEKDTK